MSTDARRKSGEEIRAIRMAMLTVICDTKDAMSADVARAVGARPKNVAEMLRNMMTKGYLESHRHVFGYTWRITAAGRDYLAAGCVKPIKEKPEPVVEPPMRVLDTVDDGKRWWKVTPPTNPMRWNAPRGVSA